MKTETSSLRPLNIYRLHYHESKALMQAINKGQIEANRGYWLNQCKKDKKRLRAHCEKLRNQFNTRKA